MTASLRAADAPCAAFEALAGGVWRARWNAATGTPSRVYGTGLRLADGPVATLEEARRLAHASLARFSDFLRLGESEFREAIAAPMGQCWTFVFDQFHGGLPVVGGRADIRIHKSGVLSMLGSVAVQVPPTLRLVPTLGEEAATAAAAFALRDMLGGHEPSPAARDARLVLWADVEGSSPARAHLVHEIRIDARGKSGEGPIGRAFVDAHTGGLLQWQSDKHQCAVPGCTASRPAPELPAAPPVPTTVTVMAWTMVGPSGAEAPQNVPMAGLSVAVPGLGVQVTDEFGRFTLDLAAPVTITLLSLDGDRMGLMTPGLAAPASVTVQPGAPATLQLFSAAASDTDLARANAYHWTRKTNQFVRSVLGDTPQLAVLDNIRPTVNIAAACNAYYVGNTINFYAQGVSGSACNNTAFSSVVAHEWGHGLDDRYGGVANAPGEGLSEGWGDTLAMYLLDRPEVGLDFYGIPGSVLRSGNNTVLYGTQNAPHAAGQSWMGFAWTCRELLRQSYGQAAALSVSNSVVLGSIVADAMTQPDAMIEVFLADDDDGSLLNGVPHYAELSAAAAQKGIPFPQQQIAIVAHEPLLDTDNQHSARGVQARCFAVASGSITQATLVYTLPGSVPVVQPLARDLRPDGFVGLIPSVSRGVVRYHIEAVHSSGYVVRSPAAGDHAYEVLAVGLGPFVPFAVEDFEGGAPGWGSARLSGAAGNWEIDRPSGFGGTAGGVSWADPVYAPSGRNACGTSLRNGSGAYPGGSTTVMRSPVFDCTGRTNVYLRCQRWLSVQRGALDQAWIAVNGVQVWSNDAVQDHLDFQWTPMEILLPMADGNPSVQVEFGLAADAAVEFGGWAIDDFALGERQPPPPGPRLSFLPELRQGAGPMTLDVQAYPFLPFLFLLHDSPGPTVAAGLPPLLLGGNQLVELFGYLDATGRLTYSFQTAALPVGFLAYTQVITLDPSLQIVVTNACTNLFRP